MGVYVLVVLTIGAYLPSPLYPAYQALYGISDLTMTLVYAVFGLISAPSLLLFGPASDALGPRSVLRASIVVAAAGSVCFAVASGTGWLLAGRAAQGVALGAATGAASALISEGAGGRNRVSGAVLASTAFVAGTAAGPIVGGVLAQYAPAPHVLPYVLHLALLGFGWFGVSSLGASVQRVRRWRPTRPAVPRGMRALFTTAAATGFLAWTVAGLFLAIIPMLLNQAGETNLAVIGCILGAVLICSVAAQPLVDRLGARRAQLVGLGALLVSLTLLAVTAAASASVTLVAAVIAGAGHGLAYGGAAAAIDACTPAAQRGAIIGALYPAFYLGAGFPAVAVGLVTLMQSLTTATTWVTVAAAILVPLIAVAVARVEHPKVAPRKVASGVGTRSVQLRRVLRRRSHNDDDQPAHRRHRRDDGNGARRQYPEDPFRFHTALVGGQQGSARRHRTDRDHAGSDRHRRSRADGRKQPVLRKRSRQAQSPHQESRPWRRTPRSARGCQRPDQ